ncbi:hypothetical protein ACFQV2_30980 [Actinokineospora soli]|uniref:Serine/threonine protein kinase n=1 Tax=Actinokineospora soli TaxID=1048753 RepID=A0ABW2TXL1_9PSEU
MLVTAYVAASSVLGATLLAAPPAPEATGLPRTTYVYEPSAPTPSGPSSTADSPTGRPLITTPSPSMVALPIPEGYQRVAGPGGLLTTVPKGWTITRSTGPGSVQATDPDDPDRFVRYGGAPSPAEGLNESHVDYAKQFAASKPGYTSIRLDALSYRGVPAVEWEFAHDAPGGRRHAKSLYWRVDGTEFFIYAASSTDRWSETEPIYRTMMRNTEP